MKAQRRHELKTNTLARGLEGLPGYWREYGSRVLLFITVVLVAFLVVRFWMQRRQQEQVAVERAGADAFTAIQRLGDLPRSYSIGPAAGDFIAQQRQALVQEAESSIDTMLSSKDPKVLALAYVARGDLDWKLATLPPVPGAETRPTLGVGRSPEDLLNAAKQAYEKVLEPPLNEQVYASINARLSLAAIAENEHDWDAAKRHYQAIIDDPKLQAYQAYKQYAKERLALLPQIQQPALLVPATKPAATTRAAIPPFPFSAPSTEATTAPASTEPSTAPATEPSTPATQSS